MTIGILADRRYKNHDPIRGTDRRKMLKGGNSFKKKSTRQLALNLANSKSRGE